VAAVLAVVGCSSAKSATPAVTPSIAEATTSSLCPAADRVRSITGITVPTAKAYPSSSGVQCAYEPSSTTTINLGFTTGGQAQYASAATRLRATASENNGHAADVAGFGDEAVHIAFSEALGQALDSLLVRFGARVVLVQFSGDTASLAKEKQLALLLR
jgi:hypothetical protein